MLNFLISCYILSSFSFHKVFCVPLVSTTFYIFPGDGYIFLIMLPRSFVFISMKRFCKFLKLLNFSSYMGILPRFFFIFPQKLASSYLVHWVTTTKIYQIYLRKSSKEDFENKSNDGRLNFYKYYFDSAVRFFDKNIIY